MSGSRSGNGAGPNNNGNGNNEEVNQPTRTLHDYLHPARQTTPLRIVMPPTAGQFEIKPGVIQLLPKFHGLKSESAYLHLKKFEEVRATIQLQNVGADVVKLRLFSFSLKDRAEAWLHAPRPNTITTWNTLVTEFLKKFFPQHKTNTLKREIVKFRQKEREHFKCWEKFNEVILACPHHGLRYGG